MRDIETKPTLLHNSRTAKVNVRTGMAGWHKRINRNFRQVAREATLNDEIQLDPNRDALGHMQRAARKTVLKSCTDRIALELGSMENMLTVTDRSNGAGLSTDAPAASANVAASSDTGLIMN